MEIDSEICNNFQSYPEIEGLNIGYAEKSRLYFVVIPSLSIIANIFVLLTCIRKTGSTNKKQYNKLF
jgi:hypothetical protein